MIFSHTRNFIAKCFRVLVHSIIGFIKDDCYTKASVLTFYTLQSIVPLFAFILGIAKGFGLEQFLEKQLEESFTGQSEFINYVIRIAHAMLNQIQHGVIVGIGVALLIWANLNLLGYVEISLNEIWKIRELRSYFRRFTDYIGVIILFFLIFIVLSSLTVYANYQIRQLGTYHYLETVSKLLLWGLNLAPVVASWVLFFCLYYLMPNAGLRIRNTVAAAIIAGSVFQAWQFFYINFQAQIFNYNTVYGAFAALPLFIIWLQFSWMIVLWGAEIAVNIENDLIYEKHMHVEHVETITQKELGLLVLYPCLKTFYSGETPMNDVQIAAFLHLPLNITENMIDTLVEGKILTQVKCEGLRSPGYHPLYDPSQISIKHVCDIIEKKSDLQLLVAQTDYFRKIREILNKLDNALESTYLNINLNELLETAKEIDKHK